MKNILRSFCLFASVLVLFVPAFADTIRLKDGNVIRGQVIGFKDQQFTVLVGSGAQGRRSRTLIYVEDVESIEFDSATTAAAAALSNDEGTSNSSNTTAPVYQPPRSNPDTNRPPVRTNSQSSPGTSPTFFTIKVAVRADNANNGWTNSGLVVRQGQRLRISGTGRVSLGRGRFSTPTGIAGSPDNDKLLRNEATGALIAVIGDDNDDFLLIGTRRDFVAQRDGVLFLGVNEGNLNDNTGTYDVVIEAEAGGSGPR
ncbi:MAG TPA: LecA/PA-IL family lectin [Pyrinomonadaceae bacterium]|jgi:PA-IL-like protein